MSDYRELLLGCGRARDKRVLAPGTGLEWRGLTTLDRNPEVGANVVADLDNSSWDWVKIILKTDCSLNRFHPELSLGIFDEIHAYEVLEHLGHLGDAIGFFNDFTKIWWLLKPGGYLCATVPSRYSPHLWGDPGHRRAILPESLTFLSQPNYERWVGTTPMSDYRDMYKADFDIVRSDDNKHTFTFILQAVKPSRIKE